MIQPLPDLSALPEPPPPAAAPGSEFSDLLGPDADNMLSSLDSLDAPISEASGAVHDLTAASDQLASDLADGADLLASITAEQEADDLDAAIQAAEALDGEFTGAADSAANL